MPRRCAALALLLILGCAKPPPPPEQTLADALEHLEQTVREDVADERRRDAVLAVTGQVYELALASATRERAWATRLREANRRYDTTPDELEALVSQWREERRQDLDRLIALRIRLADLLTAEEWERLAKHRLASLQAYLDAVRAALERRALEGREGAR
ncbi:MAG: hypothetical protein IT380_17480 [Myxococcales bacterium]|nr:hypothetical protein [Myxococcales bacterium]